MVALGLLVLAPVLARLEPAWAAGQRVPHWALGAALVGLLAGSLRLFAGRTRLFVLGALAGLLALVIR